MSTGLHGLVGLRSAPSGGRKIYGACILHVLSVTERHGMWTPGQVSTPVYAVYSLSVVHYAQRVSDAHHVCALPIWQQIGIEILELHSQNKHTLHTPVLGAGRSVARDASVTRLGEIDMDIFDRFPCANV